MRSIDFQALSILLPLPVVLDYLAWSPSHRERAGLRGWCPLHSRNPHPSRSFSVSYSGEWYCHICRTGGDGLRLFQLFTGLSLYESSHLLAAALKVDMPYLSRRKPRKRARYREEAEYGGDAGGPPPRTSLSATNRYRTSPLPDWWPV